MLRVSIPVEGKVCVTRTSWVRCIPVTAKDGKMYLLLNAVILWLFLLHVGPEYYFENSIEQPRVNLAIGGSSVKGPKQCNFEIIPTHVSTSTLCIHFTYAIKAPENISFLLWVMWVIGSVFSCFVCALLTKLKYCGWGPVGKRWCCTLSPCTNHSLNQNLMIADVCRTLFWPNHTHIVQMK